MDNWLTRCTSVFAKAQTEKKSLRENGAALNAVKSYKSTQILQICDLSNLKRFVEFLPVRALQTTNNHCNNCRLAMPCEQMN